MTYTVAKMNGRLYRVLRTADAVPFSTETGWVLLTPDVGVPERKVQHLRWVSSNTRFEWVRTFNFE